MNKMFGFKYKCVFDETVDAIIITDGSSERILDVNKSACELTGYEKEYLTGKCLSDILEEKSFTDLHKTPDKFVMYGSVLCERKVKSRSGQLVPVDMTINTFCDGSGSYVMTTLRDVSERIKYENKIVLMNEELSKINASKDKLFSIIAHDLKNPMMALMGLSEILSDGTEEISKDEIAEFSGMIKDLSKNTYELLENLLNWARVQTKNIEIQKTEFSLLQLVEKNINVLKPSAELKEITLVNKIDPGDIITADEVMINTVIRNLISNSIKFTPGNKDVTVEADEDDEKWNIHVIDEGIGMEESYIENLFKIDVPTSRYGTNKEKGTGLGLLLCYEFIKLHGGGIKVLSEVNKGTEFIIQLPK